ncbi:hypothetical protein [Pseudomonas poae]|uniref:hypothetical protein n=1 Tax=Pseudomonas poae TaxID=200451 RepID=UPI00114D2A69|nr:hypothetical protein [Pseudomonas poae]
MKLSSPKKLVDMNSFLPLDGESSIEILYAGTELIIDVFLSPMMGVPTKKKRFDLKRQNTFISCRSLGTAHLAVQVMKA